MSFLKYVLICVEAKLLYGKKEAHILCLMYDSVYRVALQVFRRKFQDIFDKVNTTRYERKRKVIRYSVMSVIEVKYNKLTRSVRNRYNQLTRTTSVEMYG